MKKLLIIGVIILLFGISLMPSYAADEITFGNTIYVDDDNINGPWDGTQEYPYRYIQDAIDNASDGDTVFVYSGTYYENVFVDKSIVLIGEDRDSTVIDSGGNNDTIYVSADWVNISGFTIKNSGNHWYRDAGIDVHSDYNTIMGNNIVSHQYNGMRIHSSYNAVYRNNISSVGGGIVTDGYENLCCNNLISENIIVNAGTWGIYSVSRSFKNTICRNFVNSSNVAIQLTDSNDNTICDNYANNNSEGMFIHECKRNIIRGNTFINSSYAGIDMNEETMDNIVFHNNFISNKRHAYDWTGRNMWYSEYPSGGNYWDDYYNGSDDYHGPNQDVPGGDGMWDDPYIVSGSGNIDWYPYMYPNGWHNNTHGANLECLGSLYWDSVKPGSTKTGTFYVENIGEPGSELDWEITKYPDWGTWSFTPSDGDDLTPEDGIIGVEVSVVAPDEQEKTFTGEIKIVNKENNSDFCTVQISLATPKNKIIDTPFLRFLENHPRLFPILRYILTLFIL